MIGQHRQTYTPNYMTNLISHLTLAHINTILKSGLDIEWGERNFITDDINKVSF